MILQEWKNKLPFFLVRHVETSGASELCRAAELADAHALLVESSGGRERERGKPVRPFSEGTYMGSDGESRGYGPSYSRPTVSCGYCKKAGHNISECPPP